MASKVQIAGSRAGRAGFFIRTAASLIAALVPSAAAAEVVVGEPAPEFELQGSDGKAYTLKAILGGGAGGVVLAFFPKAFTPG
jgi:peroxiredoxin Q/BCP